MTLTTRHSRADRLVAGTANAVHPRDARVDRFLDDLRTSAASERAPEPNSVLASLLVDGRPRAGAPPINAASLRPRATSARPRARLRLAAIIVAGTTALCGMAAAGALPAPVQHAVARVVQHIGIDLPGAPAPHRAPSRPRRGTRPAPHGATTTVANPPTTSGATGGAPGTAPSPPSAPLPSVTLPTVTLPAVPGGGVSVPTVPTLPTVSPGAVPPIATPTIP
jgi:hypothetical protein